MSDILVYSRTTGYRHESIPAGIAAFRELGERHGFTVSSTEDPEGITGLDRYAAVVFLSTSGDVLTPDGRDALRTYVETGGGFLGIHSAACTEYGWPFYGDLVGARFAEHPDIQPAVVRVEDRTHPATAHLPEEWRHTDEWYDFDSVPRPGTTVLASVDEGTYTGGHMGESHPLIWCRTAGDGRSFYTALGHSPETYQDPLFRAHLLGALTWVRTKE